MIRAPGYLVMVHIMTYSLKATLIPPHANQLPIVVRWTGIRKRKKEKREEVNLYAYKDFMVMSET